MDESAVDRDDLLKCGFWCSYVLTLLWDVCFAAATLSGSRALALRTALALVRSDAFTALAQQLAAAAAAVQALAAELQPGQPRNDGSSHSLGGAGGASSRSSRGSDSSHRRAGEALQGPMTCAMVGSSLLLGCVRLLADGESLLSDGGGAAPAGPAGAAAAAAAAGAGAALEAARGAKEETAAGSAADLELYRSYASELLAGCVLVLGLATLCGIDGGSGYGTPEELLACMTVAVSGGGGGGGGAGAPGTGPPGASGAGAGPSTSAGSGARHAAGATMAPAMAGGAQPGPLVLHEPALRSLAEAAARPLHESLDRAEDMASAVAAAPAAAGTQPATGTATEHTGAAEAEASAAVAQARGAAGAVAGAAASPAEPAAARGVPIPPAAAQDILLRVAEVAIGCMEAAAAAAAPVAQATGGPGQLSAAAAQGQPLWSRLSAEAAPVLAAAAIAYAAPGRLAPGSAEEGVVVVLMRRGLDVLQLGPGAVRQQQQQPLPGVTICPGLPVALEAGLLPRLIEPVLRRQAAPAGWHFDRVLVVVSDYLRSHGAAALLATAPAREVASLLLTLRKRLRLLTASHHIQSELDARVLLMCYELPYILGRLLLTAGTVSAPQHSRSSHGGSASGGVAAAPSCNPLCSPPMTAVAALLVREVLPWAVDMAWGLFCGGLGALRRAPGSAGAPGPRGPAAGAEERRSPAAIAAAATASARERFSTLMQEELNDRYPCLLGWLALLTEQCSGGDCGGADGSGDEAGGGAAECWGDTELRTVILQDLRAGEMVRSALLAFTAAAPFLAAAPNQVVHVARHIVVACICYAALSPREWRAMVEGVGMGAAVSGVYWDAEPWCDHMALVLAAAAYDPTPEGASDNADNGDAGNEEEGSLMAQLLAMSRKLCRIAAAATAADATTDAGSGIGDGGPPPAAMDAAEDAAAVDAAWWQLVARLRRAVQKRRAAWAVAFPDGRLVMQPLSEARAQLQLPRPCSNWACVAMEVDCEAEVQLKACGGACGGAVAYCCRACQLEDWRAGHKTSCGGRAGGNGQVAQGQA
ncbi:hypothetical protein HXX76_009830 [Chlamydomonas incerta]|uniref:MYND-type domain-containing protein n=1 Tax=Chlamydomonas incerta TaxID=51695 RepID=A0A835VZN0_CHLIN|nr:hypothetical protein HXX76_009830 [Chlamydomonas incerta]|eukprot:KAG2430856.1 hypothetical protein HXX76_009830 [Chlamydomonas incerta]